VSMRWWPICIRSKNEKLFSSLILKGCLKALVRDDP
jgi:hypothetical protein